MPKALRVAVMILIASSLMIVAAGCSGGDIDAEFKDAFEKEMGVTVKSVNVSVVPHEAQLMADQMILNSHGITDARDEELTHATVTLEGGEEVSAVKYKDKIYTYNNDAAVD